LQGEEKVISAIASDELEALSRISTVSAENDLETRRSQACLEGGVKGVHIVGGTESGRSARPAMRVLKRRPPTFDAIPGTRILRDTHSAAMSAHSQMKSPHNSQQVTARAR